MRLIYSLILFRYGIQPDFVLNHSPQPPVAMVSEPVASDLGCIINRMKAEANDWSLNQAVT